MTNLWKIIEIDEKLTVVRHFLNLREIAYLFIYQFYIKIIDIKIYKKYQLIEELFIDKFVKNNWNLWKIELGTSLFELKTNCIFIIYCLPLIYQFQITINIIKIYNKYQRIEEFLINKPMKNNWNWWKIDRDTTHFELTRNLHIHVNL